MTAIKTLVLGVLFVHLFGGGPANAQTAGETAAQIGQFLDGSGDLLSPADRRYVEGKLEDVEYVLEEYGYSRASVFRTALEGDQIKIYARATGELLLTWNHHDTMQIRGDVIALKDSLGETVVFAYRNGVKTTLVENWTKTVEVALFRDYVGLVDSEGISELWSTKEKKKLVGEWKHTVQHVFKPDFAVLRDNEAAANMDVYDVLGNKVVAQTGVTSFALIGPRLLSYTQNGQTRTIDLSEYL